MTHKFKFRLRSEHTIEGQDFDVELQIIYIAKNPENNFFYSVVSVLFDRKNFTKAKVTSDHVEKIDRFFDSLELKKVKNETAN